MRQKQIESIIPGQLSSIVVNGDLASALRQYKKMQKQSNIIVELYDRKFYTKKSVSNRKQLALAKFLQQKESER